MTAGSYVRQSLSSLLLGRGNPMMVFLFLIAFTLPAVAQYHRPVRGEAPKESYELQFLGCKLTKDKNSRSHTGLFLFIWKGEKATQVLAYFSPHTKTFHPFPSFGIHYASGWKGRGEWCGTGAEWIDVQPGQVLPFVMDMGWVEQEMPGFPSLQGADKARFSISSIDGEMVSDDIVLPLFPDKE